MGFGCSMQLAIGCASNQCDVDWLRYGPADLLRYWRWVEELADLYAKQELTQNVMKALHIDSDLLAVALNHSPPAITCGMIFAVLQDLQAPESDHDVEYHDVHLDAGTPERERERVITHCQKILKIIHSKKVEKLIKKQYVAKAARRHFYSCRKHRQDWLKKLEALMEPPQQAPQQGPQQGPVQVEVQGSDPDDDEEEEDFESGDEQEEVSLSHPLT